MTEQIASLRKRLASVHDDALEFFKHIEGLIGAVSEFLLEERSVWSRLDEGCRNRADDLGRRARELMAEISSVVRDSPLMDRADLRDLGMNAKRMAAAVRFRRYWYRDVYVHHDEDIVLGVCPPTQGEDELQSVDEACALFREAYKSTTERLDLASPPVAGSMIAPAARAGQPVVSYRKNSAFIMMWINREHPELDDVRDTVKDVSKRFGTSAVRADEIEHEGTITDRVIEEIMDSEFLFADLTGERPSVYYEVAYAHALGKRVILFRKKGTTLHFDLAGHNCPEYENLGDLRRRLEKRLSTIIKGTD